MSAPHQPTPAALGGRMTLQWVIIGLGATLLTLAAHADGGRRWPAQVPAGYGEECASCHVAYPPGMLPAVSWQRLLGNLSQHYGSDASLSPSVQTALADWLVSHAGTHKRVREAPPQDRITRTAWFERQHRHVPEAVWRLPSVKTPAQCQACHDGAERGVFSDHRLQEPAGLTPAQRRAWRDRD